MFTCQQKTHSDTERFPGVVSIREQGDSCKMLTGRDWSTARDSCVAWGLHFLAFFFFEVEGNDYLTSQNSVP